MRFHAIGSLSATLVAGLFLAAPARAQEPCNPATYGSTCDGDVLTYCSSTTSQTDTLNCATELFTSNGAPVTDETVTCGTLGCTGAACGTGIVECVGEINGGTCAGWSYVILDDVDNAFFPLCAEGGSCVTSIDDISLLLEDTCRAQVGEDCAVGELHKGCVGEVATACLGTDTAPAYALTDAVGVDCASYGSTCQLDAQGAPFCESGLDEVCDPVGGLVQCQAGLVCNPDTSLCEAACDPATPDSCTDDVLSFCDVNGIIGGAPGLGYDLNCAADVLSGTCAPQGGADAVCLVGQGGLCLDASAFAGSPFQCAAGLACGNFVDGVGECLPAMTVDGGPAPVDGGDVDGGPAPVDAGTDGGPAPVDAGVDGGPAPVDAGTGGEDAGTGGEDAGTGGEDAGTGGEDAGTPPPPVDAGNGGQDAGTPPPPVDAGGNGGQDAGTQPPPGDDAGDGDDDPETPPESGCACGSTGASDGMGLGLFALALLALRRKRR